jgi:hypothetical protein
MKAVDEQRRSAQIAELVEYVNEQSSLLHEIGKQLQPYWQRARGIKEAIAQTHFYITGEQAIARGMKNIDPGHPEWLYVIGHNPTRKTSRTALFLELDRLNEVFCVAKRRYADLQAEIRSATRILKGLRKDLERKTERPSKRKPQKPQQWKLDV